MKRFILGALAVLLSATCAMSQWRMPARQTSTDITNFDYIPTSKTNAQLVFDWLDDNVPFTAGDVGIDTNDFNVIGPLGTGTNVQDVVDFIDDWMYTRWTNNFVVLPDITTNLFGIWPFMTNVDNQLSSLTGTVATLALKKQPWATWVYSGETQRLLTSAGTWSILTNHASNLEYLRDTYSNGISRLSSGGDNYWIIPTGGLYQVNLSVGLRLYGPTDGGGADFSTWVQGLKGGAAPGDPIMGRTVVQFQHATNALANSVLSQWYKQSGSALLALPADSTVRVYATVSGTSASADVTYVSFDLHKIGE